MKLEWSAVALADLDRSTALPVTLWRTKKSAPLSLLFQLLAHDELRPLFHEFSLCSNLCYKGEPSCPVEFP
jgi:hypothetical protein